MKNYLRIITLALTVMTVGSCSTRREANPTGVAQKDGMITIRATGEAYTGRGLAPSTLIDAWAGDSPKRNAEIEAFRQLLFYGIPSTQQWRPLIVGANEAALMQQHKVYFEQMLGKSGRYWSFVVQSKVVRQKSKGVIFKEQATMDVTINLRTLRTDLEQNGVIRKFGY
jgi:hypothetical protein